MDVRGDLHDLRGPDPAYAAVLNPDDYQETQGLGERLQAAAAEGLIYPSVRNSTVECAGLRYPEDFPKLRRPARRLVDVRNEADMMIGRL